MKYFKRKAVKGSGSSGKKQSGCNPSEWKCNHGCKNTVTPCKHLETLIQDPPSTSVKASTTGKIDKFYYESGAGYVIPKEIKDRTWELAFREKLTKSGLEPSKVDILVCRFVYDMSMSEIASELNYVSISTVLRMLSDSLKYLKKVGFSKK